MLATVVSALLWVAHSSIFLLVISWAAVSLPIMICPVISSAQFIP